MVSVVDPLAMLIFFPDTYRNLQDELLSIVGCRKGVQDRRELLGIELDCVMGLIIDGEGDGRHGLAC